MSSNPSADGDKPDVEPINPHDVRVKRGWMRFKRADEVIQVTLVRAFLGFVRVMSGPDRHGAAFDETNCDRGAIERGLVRVKRDERAIKAPLVHDKARFMLALTRVVSINPRVVRTKPSVVSINPRVVRTKPDEREHNLAPELDTPPVDADILRRAALDLHDLVHEVEDGGLELEDRGVDPKVGPREQTDHGRIGDVCEHEAWLARTIRGDRQTIRGDQRTIPEVDLVIGEDLPIIPVFLPAVPRRRLAPP